MAPDPSRRLGLLLLLLTCRLAPSRADLLSLDWLWPTNLADSRDPLASQPQGSLPVPPTAAPTTHVAAQDDPAERGAAPASPRPPSEDPEAIQSRAPGAPSNATAPSPAASPDTRGENVAGVGAKILSVAQGIRSFVQLWDEATPTGSSAGSASAPTDALALAGPSSTPEEGGTLLRLHSGAPSSPATQATESGTLAVPTQPPPSLDRLQAPLRERLMPRESPGRASVSSALGGDPPWGSQPSPGRPQHLDGEGRVPAAAGPSQPCGRPVVGWPLPLPLVTGPPGARSALPALSARPAAQLPPAAAAALTGSGGAGASHTADPAGPGLADDSALLGAGPPTPTSRCLPLPPTLPVCGHLGIGHSWLPNHLHHESGEEVQAAARAWGGLLRTRCHPFLTWFFCLLLAPPCGPGPLPALPPCRQFCEALRDACWSRLDGGRLPVACASLPAREDGHCVFIGPAAGNWLVTGRPALL